MRQRIQSGKSRHTRRHRDRRFRVYKRYIRHDDLADDRHLGTPRHRIDDRKLRNIGRRAGRCRDANQRRPGHRDGVHALVIKDMPAIGDNHRNALGAIHDTTAAQRDDHIAPRRTVEIDTGHDLVVTRIGRHIAENSMADPRLVEISRQLAQPACRHHAGIGHHQNPLGIQVTRIHPDFVPGAHPENKFRDYEFAKFKHKYIDYLCQTYYDQLYTHRILKSTNLLKLTMFFYTPQPGLLVTKP